MSTQTAARHTPVGFGRGRRTNRIAVIEPNSSDHVSVPGRVPVWPLNRDVDSWFRTAFCGFASATQMTGFYLTFQQWLKGQSAEEVARTAFPDHADAAIILAPRDEHKPLLAALEDLEAPFVITYARSEEPRHAWVACQNREAISRVVQHIADLGHTRIAFLTGPPNVADFQERKRGYLAGMSAAGLEVDPQLVVESRLRLVSSDIAPAAASMLRRRDRPTAAVCATDLMARVAIEAAWEVGLRVPDDLAVVGFDDSDYAAESAPALTTVRQPILEVANQAGYLAACAVIGQEPETGGWQIEIPTELVVRESCGAAQAGASSAPPPRQQAMRRELEHHMRQLAATQAQMEQLLYVASHDLRAPLITIEGFGTILQRRCWNLLDARGRDCVTRILRSVENLRKLTDALLTLSRAHRQALSLQRIDVADVVARVLRDLEVPIAERKVEVRVSSQLPTVTADETALYQILMNLVGNAVKFLGDQPEHVVSITYRFRSDEHQFSVRDNGCGIAPEHQENIFQLFRRSPDAANTEGRGVGLSIVKNLVLRHGGRIWVESEKGAGATFHFTLPLDAPDPKP